MKHKAIHGVQMAQFHVEWIEPLKHWQNKLEI